MRLFLSKVLSTVLLGSILLSACGAVTPSVPTTQATMTSKPTSTFLPVPSQTITPFPIPIPSPTSFLKPTWIYTPPNFDVTRYKLKSWTDGDYAFFIDSMDKDELFVANPWFLPVFDSFYGYEYFLQDHEIDPNSELDWAIARMAPMGIVLPGMRNGEEYFNFLVEQLLNKSHASLEDLPDVLKSYGFNVEETFIVKNYYGENEDALFMDVYFYKFDIINEAGVFVIHQIDGRYQVDTIKSWRLAAGLGLGLYYSFENAIDSNKNGFPELVLGEYEGHSGQPQHERLTMWLYEWDKKAEKYGSNSFNVFSQWCDDGACDGKWEARNNGSSDLPVLVIQENWNTQEECPNLIIQRTYQWDGKEYPLTENTVLPASSERPECLVDWAEAVIRIQERGWQNNQAIKIISDALNRWPDAMDKDWGPASRDYFQLRLGIWKDLRGENDEALKLLESLAANPFIPEYSLPSQTAVAYLHERKNMGILNACQAANYSWSQGIQKNISDPFGFSMDDVARNILGFASDLWWTGIYSFSSVCSEDDAVFATAQKLNDATMPVNPAEWFLQAGRSVYMTKREDFDGDGSKDWLVVAKDAKDSRFSSAWFFFSYPNRLIPQKFTQDSFDNVTPDKWLILKPDDEKKPVYLLQIGKSLWIFRVGRDEQIESLVDDYYITLLGIDIDNGIKIAVSAQDPDYQGTKKIDIVWDSTSQTFIKVSQEYDFERAQQEVERMIFQEHDYPSAISFIQKFLAVAPYEFRQMSSCDPTGCEYYPEKYYPYMYYMMGLSYEMSSQPQEAVRAYYFLWRTYPESPYALVAQNKLEVAYP